MRVAQVLLEKDALRVILLNSPVNFGFNFNLSFSGAECEKGLVAPITSR